MALTWETARQHIKDSQKKLRKFHDNKAKDPKIAVGDQVFVYFLSKKKGKSYKFARPFQGPYLVQKVYSNGIQLKRIGHPRSNPLRVALNRVCRCPRELAESEVNSSDATAETSLDLIQNPHIYCVT